MKVLLVRHAIAVPRGTPGIPDDQRPLTPKGERRFRKAARGLARVMRRPTALLTSPLPRARRTAEIAGKAWGRIKPTTEPALAGGSVEQLLAALSAFPEDARVVLVGHEPDLSALLARLLGSRESERLSFRKGGAALVDLAAPPAAGGRLIWFLPPRVLGDIRRR